MISTRSPWLAFRVKAINKYNSLNKNKMRKTLNWVLAAIALTPFGREIISSNK